MSRSKGIGGTDIGAIVGVNPWKGPMDVYLEKCGLVDPQDDNEAMFWGRELEEPVLRRYAKETGYSLSKTPPLIHHDYYWYVGSPDALITISLEKPIPDGLGIVDAKTTGRRDDYGEPGTDEVPDVVACQLAWYMGLTDAQWADVAVLFLSPRRQFAIYHLKRNQEIIDNLIDAGRDFWFNHIVTKIPPALDNSEATKRYLSITYPQDKGDIIPAPPSAAEWLSRLQAAREVMAESEKEKALAEAHVKSYIGDNRGILSPEWKATWTLNKPTVKVDWEEVSRHFFDMLVSVDNVNLALEDKAHRVISEFTTTKPGPRVLRITKVKEGR